MNSTQKPQKHGRSIFSLLMTVAVICLMTAVIFPGVMGAELDVELGSAEPFAILSYSGITDANPGLSLISGDIGSSPITGASMDTITCEEMNGYAIYGVDETSALVCYHGLPADKTLVDAAYADSVTAYGDAAGRSIAPVSELLGGDIGGQTLAPGLYTWTTNVNIGPGTVLTFDAAGDPTAVWILQTTGTLNMAANTNMVLAGSAQADHIYWQVAGIPGANINSGAHAEGNILAAGSINLLEGASLHGRAFSQAAAAGVTLSGNSITRADLIVPVIAAPQFVSAETNADGTVIFITFDKAMNDPAGKHAQFTYQVNGGDYEPFSAAVLNPDTNTINLTTSGLPIVFGDLVTVNYTAGTVTSTDTGVLVTFADQDVTNNIIAAPTVLSAETNTEGTVIIITFDKIMTSPAGKHAEFTYQIDGGDYEPFSAAVLNPDTHKINLTTSGTAIAFGDAVTVNYTAGTVTSTDTGVLVTFADQDVTNNIVAAPTVLSAETNPEGTVIIITFDKIMTSPAGKQAEFTYQIDGGSNHPFSAAVLNPDTNKINLTTSGIAIAFGDVVTVNYTAGTVTSTDTGVLVTFGDQAVTNNMPIADPLFVAAETNAEGTVFTITFDQIMANPAGKQAEFAYQINGGTYETFSAAALNADPTKVDLTVSGTEPVTFGDMVTVNYTAGTVTSLATGVLATFADQAVSNNMPAGPIVTVISPLTGPSGGGQVVTITGTGFLGTTKVTFDTTDVIPTTISPTEITVTAPAHAAGIVNITVTTPVGTSTISAADEYLYGPSSPDSVDLGSAGNFVILAKTGISNDPGAGTSIVGNIGVSPIAATGITGFDLVLDASTQFAKSALVNGNVYAADYSPPTPTTMETAIDDMEAAYTDAATRTAPDHTDLGAGNIGGMTLAPGLYKWSNGVTIPEDVTLSGGPNDVWIFQIAEGLSISPGKQVILSGGAQKGNIYWQVAEQTTLGSDSVFEGTILDKTAIVFNPRAALHGKALAQTAVTLIQNQINVPAATATPPVGYIAYSNGPGPGAETSYSDMMPAPVNDLLAPGQLAPGQLAPGQLAPPLASTETPVTGAGTISSTPLTVDFAGMLGVTVSWTTQINPNPLRDARIITAVQPNVNQATLDAINVALRRGGLMINNAAYGMILQNVGTSTHGPTTVSMTVSRDWVTRNGGNDAMRIVRIDTDGTVEVLHTWYDGIDPYSGYPTFRATSPESGLGASFWLVSVNPYMPKPVPATTVPDAVQKAPTQVPVTSTTQEPASGISTMMMIGGILAALSIIGIATMTVIRRNK